MAIMLLNIIGPPINVPLMAIFGKCIEFDCTQSQVCVCVSVGVRMCKNNGFKHESAN